MTVLSAGADNVRKVLAKSPTGQMVVRKAHAVLRVLVAETDPEQTVANLVFANLAFSVESRHKT